MENEECGRGEDKQIFQMKEKWEEKNVLSTIPVQVLPSVSNEGEIEIFFRNMYYLYYIINKDA